MYIPAASISWVFFNSAENYWWGQISFDMISVFPLSVYPEESHVLG